MNHTIGIVAHTSRATQARALHDRVGACYLAMDNGEHGCERNHARTWDYLKDFADTEWSLVLEDDAQPVDGFNQQAAMALDAAPAPVVSFYLGRQRPPHWQNAIRNATEQADRTGTHFIVGTHLLHAVAVAIRTDHIDAMLAHARTSRRPWDFAIAAWALQDGHTVAYTWPSLADHEDGEPAITKHPDKMARTPGRKAWRTGTRPVWQPTTTSINP